LTETGKAAGVACGRSLEFLRYLIICMKTEGKEENPFRDGRTKDLPDMYWLLVSSGVKEIIYKPP
jgi:hypothetical protein